MNHLQKQRYDWRECWNDAVRVSLTDYSLLQVQVVKLCFVPRSSLRDVTTTGVVNSPRKQEVVGDNIVGRRSASRKIRSQQFRPGRIHHRSDCLRAQRLADLQRALCCVFLATHEVMLLHDSATVHPHAINRIFRSERDLLVEIQIMSFCRLQSAQKITPGKDIYSWI